VSAVHPDTPLGSPLPGRVPHTGLAGMGENLRQAIASSPPPPGAPTTAELRAQFDRLRTENARLVAQAASLRERVENAASAMEASAAATSPSKKSQVEAACAARIRQALAGDS
jgi:hypothetical protein